MYESKSTGDRLHIVPIYRMILKGNSLRKLCVWCSKPALALEPKPSAARIHHVVWSFPAKFWPKKPEISSVHAVWEPLKQALLASRDVIISSQICVSKLQRFLTLGDGCWLPKPPFAAYPEHWFLEFSTSELQTAKLLRAL